MTGLKVAELKAMLSERGLSTTGKKDELVTRLEEATAGQGASGANADVAAAAPAHAPAPPKLPTVGVAPTERSRCQGCLEAISKGDQRVGMPDRHCGVTVTRWLHPTCFLRNILVDLAPTARASCAVTGMGIAKGEPRVLFRTLGEGVTKSQKIYKATSAAGLLSELRAAGAPVDVSSLPGMDNLPDEARRWVKEAAGGADMAGRTPPVVEGIKVARKAKGSPPVQAVGTPQECAGGTAVSSVAEHGEELSGGGGAPNETKEKKRRKGKGTGGGEASGRKKGKRAQVVEEGEAEAEGAVGEEWAEVVD